MKPAGFFVGVWLSGGLLDCPPLVVIWLHASDGITRRWAMIWLHQEAADDTPVTHRLRYNFPVTYLVATLLGYEMERLPVPDFVD